MKESVYQDIPDSEDWRTDTDDPRFKVSYTSVPRGRVFEVDGRGWSDTHI